MKTEEAIRNEFEFLPKVRTEFTEDGDKKNLMLIGAQMALDWVLHGTRKAPSNSIMNLKEKIK